MKPVIEWRHNRWFFYCPGCDAPHCVDSAWVFNGDVVAPSITPSIVTNHKCHLFVRDGWLIFLPDCRHALAGKTVEMVSIE